MRRRPFIKDIAPTKKSLEVLNQWLLNPHRPILLIGIPGIGKTRAVDHFLANLPWKQRLVTRVLVPSVEDIRNRKFPWLPLKYIILINDLQNFRSKDIDDKFRDILKLDDAKIIGTALTEKIEGWILASDDYWTINEIPPLTEKDNEVIVSKYKLEQQVRSYQTNVVDILNPDKDIESDLERRSEAERDALTNLKILHELLRTSADFEVLKCLCEKRFTKDMFKKISASSWVICQDNAIRLRDGMERHLYIQPSLKNNGHKLIHRLEKCKSKLAPSILFYLGYKYYENTEYQDAAKSWETTLKLEPRGYPAWNNWGVLLGKFGFDIFPTDEEKGKRFYHQAFEKYEKAVEIIPEFNEIWYNWGRGLVNLANHLSQSNKKEAIELLHLASEKFEKAVAIKPEDYQSWFGLGQSLITNAMLIDASDHNKAIELFHLASEKYENGIKLNKDYGPSWHNWGVCLSQLADDIAPTNESKARVLFDQAFLKYKKALEINPNGYDTWTNWGYGLCSLAEITSHTNRKEAEKLFLQAFEMFEKSSILMPENHLTYFNWGTNLGKYSEIANDTERLPLLNESINKLQAAIRYNSTISKYHYNLAMSLKLAGRTVESERELNIANKMNDE